jgi:hypothetical protein
MVDRKGPPIAGLLVLIAVGVIGIYRVEHSPRFEMYSTVDVVQLLASGVCFGAALAGVILMLRASRR